MVATSRLYAVNIFRYLITTGKMSRLKNKKHKFTALKLIKASMYISN